jgi:hypothetical protein
VDLRIFELLAKRAIPVGHKNELLPCLEHYRFVDAEHPSRTARELLQDDATRKAMAVHNVLAATAHDTAECVLRDIAKATVATDIRLGIREKLIALVALRRADDIPSLLNMLEHQYALPGSLILVADFECDAKEVSSAIERRLQTSLRIETVRSRADWKQVGAILARLSPDSWHCVIDVNCHYGPSYFSRAWALATSGIAPIFHSFREQDTNLIDAASLIFDQPSGFDLATKLGNTGAEVTAAVTRDAVIVSADSGADFHRSTRLESNG